MIDPLHFHNIIGPDGSVIGVQAPDNTELMDKINEIIEVVNKLTKEQEPAQEEQTNE